MLLLNATKDAFMARGGWRGGGRPPKTEGEKREHFGCRLAVRSLDWLKAERERTGKSAGEIVDRAIEVLQDTPKWHYPNKAEAEE